MGPHYCIFLASVFPEDVIHHISSLLICELRYMPPYLSFEDVNVLSTTHRRSQVNEMQAEPKLEGFIRPGIHFPPKAFLETGTESYWSGNVLSEHWSNAGVFAAERFAGWKEEPD